jgi:hypothetical protein
MTKAEKRKFIKDLTAAVARDAIAKIDRMPEEWDGHELRRYLADQFDREVSALMNIKGARANRSRFRAYRNTIATTNL